MTKPKHSIAQIRNLVRRWCERYRGVDEKTFDALHSAVHFLERAEMQIKWRTQGPPKGVYLLEDEEGG